MSRISRVKAGLLPILAAVAAIASVPAHAAEESEKLKAVTTFTVIADIARNVAGDKAIVESVTKPGAEIHNYQPSPKDIVRAQDADVILWNGLYLERWFKRFLRDVGKDVPSVVISEGVEPLPISEGAYEGRPNPHAWLSASAVQTYIDNIRDTFARLDPDNADVYRRNAARYKDKIRAIRNDLENELAFIPENKRYLVTSEGAFSYLARDLDMKEVYLWPMNADQQGTPQQVREVIDTVREHDIPVVFSESTISPQPAKQVAAATGAIYGGKLYVDSLTTEDGPVPTYLDLLKVTTGTIADGFKEGIRESKQGQQ